jgi:hypothetical protein
MAQLLSVPQSEWRPFFDRMSKALLGKWAEIYSMWHSTGQVT